MAYEKEKEYLSKLPPGNPLSSLSEQELENAFDIARSTLSAYHTRHLKPNIIVIQALHASDFREYDDMRKQGITSFSTSRGSVSFDSSKPYSAIAPGVLELLGEPPANIGSVYYGEMPFRTGNLYKSKRGLY